MPILFYRPACKSAEKVLAESTKLTGQKNSEAFPAGTSGLVFRWGCISDVPDGVSIVNSAKNIRKVFDKKAFRIDLYKHGLAMRTFGDFGELLDLNDVQDLQWIVRPSEHQRSENIFFCKTLRDVYDATRKSVMRDGYYVSQFIPKVAEYRALVVSGRIIAMIQKTPEDENEVSWGCVSDGDFEYISWSNWPAVVSKTAIGAMKLSELTFGAVDIIVDGQGQAYCLEVNTAPHLTPYYARCFAKAFEYIIDHGKDSIPVTGESWKHYIHPAISGEAI